MRPAVRMLAAWSTALAVAATTTSSYSGLPLQAARARAHIYALELNDAAGVLDGNNDSAVVAIERGRLALYRGRCDDAVVALDRPDVQASDEGTLLATVAKGCARATAATITVRDEQRGVVVRLQDDADRALVPLIADAAARAREALARDLGTTLPRPVRIELVRDQLSLAALSGLSEQAAQTTGTVAVAKWGRVIMISPRAAHHGYPWLDTLAHEMTHLVISQATRERAPLWLQEGVAKRQETRWREPTMFDGQPSPDAVARRGIREGLDLPLTKMGPSIAMLPSPERASIAFAEVASFIEYWTEQVGHDALPELLTAIRDAPLGGHAASAVATVSGRSLAEWERRWRAHLAQTEPALTAPADAVGALRNAHELARRDRLGELLLGRGHYLAATRELEIAFRLTPNDADIRCLYAQAHLGAGRWVEALDLVARPADIRSPSARWLSLNDALQMGDAMASARWHALALDPLSPPVACHELPAGEYPGDPVHRALCEAAWQVPR